MALVTYLIGPCAGGASILVDFDSSSLPAVNGNYYLTFTGGTTQGCYDIIDNAEPATGIDKVLSMSIDYTDCATCFSVNPTPTPTPTVTTTPTKTPTPTRTSSVTPTPTGTSAVTPTPTPTRTPGVTPTPTGTSAVTPTPTPTRTAGVTPTPSVTTTQTGTPGVTPTKTPTPSVTATQTQTPTNTATKTPTPTQTGTSGVTPTPTQTQTGTPAVTPTPSHTPNYVISADQQYAYTLEILGSFSGGSADFSGAYAPHPVFTNELGEAVQQLNGIAIGGFNGLNN